MSASHGGASSAVLFDLDGTFADTAPDMANALNLMRDRHGLPPLPLAKIRPHVSRGARGMLEIGFGISSQHQEFVGLRDTFYDIYQDNVCVESKLFDGIETVLEFIEQRSIAWGIVTNKAARFAMPLAQILGFERRAGCIVCGDTTPHTKPHPAPLLYAAKLIGIAPSRTIYVGDDERDVQAARAAGMRAAAAAYGYISAESDANSWGADFVFSVPTELIGLINLIGE